jgi:hypothetical protein
MFRRHQSKRPVERRAPASPLQQYRNARYALEQLADDTPAADRAKINADYKQAFRAWVLSVAIEALEPLVDAERHQKSQFSLGPPQPAMPESFSRPVCDLWAADHRALHATPEQLVPTGTDDDILLPDDPRAVRKLVLLSGIVRQIAEERAARSKP